MRREAIGQQIVLVEADSEGELDAAFATLAQRRVGALAVAADPSARTNHRAHRTLCDARSGGSAAVGSLLQATRAVPIVFVQVAELGAGFVEILPQPGGNVTVFMLYEYGIGTKWLELLKEIAPGVKRVAFLQTSGNAELGPLAWGEGTPQATPASSTRHQGIRAFLKWRSNRGGRGWGRFIAARDLFGPCIRHRGWPARLWA